MAQIRNSSLLYRPSLSIWTARKKDKAETVKVNAAAGAVTGAANVNKQLLPDSKELLAIQKWANEFRAYCYARTLPWDDAGWRIGKVQEHMTFMGEVGDRMRVGEDLVDAFIASYEAEKSNARFTLNHMFNPEDYPGENEVRGRFRFSVDVMPVGNAEDFRVVEGIPQAEVDQLVQIAQAGTEQRIAEAMKEAYTRLYTVVSKMANTLQQYGDKTIKKFNDSLVDNIVDLVGIMPALNLTDDPLLAELSADAVRLASYDLSDLRQVESTRDAAIVEATTLAKKFGAMLAVDTTFTNTSVKNVAAKSVPQPASINELAGVDMAALFADVLEG